MKTREFRKTGARAPFNLVEVIIALVIIMVVLVGIMGVMPSGMNANADALARSNGSDAADQFLHFMATKIEMTPTTADHLQTKAAMDAELGSLDDRTVLFGDNNLLTEVLANNVTNPLSEAVNIRFRAANVSEQWPPAASTSLFKVTHFTKDMATEDFVGILRAWKEVTSTVRVDGVDQPRSLRLYAEVSWPAQAVYAKRHKENYQLDVFRPTFTVADAVVTNNEDCRTVGPMAGDIVVNPNNSTWQELCLITASGLIITKNNFQEYTGVIKQCCFRVKASQSDLTVASNDYDFANQTYMIGGSNVVVHLYSTGGNTWHLEVLSSSPDAYIDKCNIACGERGQMRQREPL